MNFDEIIAIDCRLLLLSMLNMHKQNLIPSDAWAWLASRCDALDAYEGIGRYRLVILHQNEASA